MRSWTLLSGCVAVLLLAGAGRTAALEGGQNQGGLPHSSAPPTVSAGSDSALPGTMATDPYAGKMQAAQARAVRDDRHKKLVQDTEKLVQLSNELKVEVDKAGKDDLSLTVIKKAGDIEKLAHDVKERMKN